MRTLIESILDGDLNVHDEAVFTEQIIPEIRNLIHPAMQEYSKDMTIKLENGKRILCVGGERSLLEVGGAVGDVLEKYNIHEIRSEGRLTVHTNLTGFNISAPNIKINSYLKNHIYEKCNITCDTLSIGGLDDSSIKCNRCKIKVKTYEINRTPIEFINSKVIGLSNVQIFLEADPTREELDKLGVKYSKYGEFAPGNSFDENASRFDPLEKLAGIKSITKLPNIYLYTRNEAVLKYDVRLIFKSPHTPLDRQIAKAVTWSKKPIDCANNYQAIFTDFKY